MGEGKNLFFQNKYLARPATDLIKGCEPIKYQCRMQIDTSDQNHYTCDGKGKKTLVLKTFNF